MTNQQQTLEYIRNSVTAVPDYPKPGILFRDITSLIADPRAFQETIHLIKARFATQAIDKVIGTEARGFIFGAPIALALDVGFVPVRKPGKLPRDIFEESYELEYGQDTLQMHKDAIAPGDRVLIVDDLLATGGTVEATIKLAKKAGGIVTDAAFVIELSGLGGAACIKQHGVDVFSLITYPA